MRKQIPQFLCETVGLFIVGEIPVTLTPRGDCPDDAIDHLLQGILSLRSTQKPAKVFLSHNI
jgi:hypothetical protein